MDKKTWRARLHEIIFEADTRSGKSFDVVLIVCILLSVSVVMLDSVEDVSKKYHALLMSCEWTFTVLFTIEYVFRLFSVGKPLRYATSFFGVVDLLAILPTYLSPLLQGSEAFVVVRLLRTLRIFRVLKLVQYVAEARLLLQALRSSGRKLLVFIAAILTIVTIFGSIMYVVEGRTNPEFSSIPKSIYWAIVTLTTVGYGDIAPKSGFGQAISSVVMVLGYGVIAVPTGMVTVEMMRDERARARRSSNTQSCPSCAAGSHDNDAVHCKHCGTKL